MNRLDDTLTEVQAAFEKEYEKRFGHSKLGASFRAEVAHFFIAGRDSLREEFSTAKPKRTISRVIPHDGSLYLLSSDGKLFMKNGHLSEWVQLPDLPQKD